MTCRRLGSASALNTWPSGSAVDMRERGGLEVERGRPGRRRLDDDQAGALRVVGQRELDLALVVPREGETLRGSDGGDGRVALFAVRPAEARRAARPEVDLDLVREPVLEALGLGQGVPQLLARHGEDDLAANHVQPPGCARVATRRLHVNRRWQMQVGSVIPMVVDSSGSVERASDIYSRLLRELIVFLGREVDDELANLVAAQLLYLDAEDPGKDISLYVNSPGGSAYAGMAIYDAMQYVQSDVSTVCLGMGMSAAAMILCGGAAGKRFALPNSKIMIHQGSGGFRGTPADIQIAAREILGMTRRMAELISLHSGRDVEQVMVDIDRDNFMTPAEAVDYGVVDAIIQSRPSSKEE